MKVILLRDVAKLGKRFELAEVPDGYAQNKLIPQGLAQNATPENIKKINERKNKLQADAESEQTSFKASCEALKDTPITITVEANEQGHLFKAIKEKDIAAALVAAGHQIPLEAIRVKDPIKSTGTHAVELVSGNVSGIVNLEITPKK